MAIFKKKFGQKKFLKAVAITAGVVIAISVGLHIWFINNARRMLKEMVAEKSHGKLKLELDELSFDFIDNKLKVREVIIASTDTTSQPVTYRIQFRKLTVKINSLWPLLARKEILLDSIKLHDPSIEITQWRKDTAQNKEADELSVPQQMGTLYNSMLDGLSTFGIRRIIVNNATVRLVNKLKPDAQPVVISKIDFDLFKQLDEDGKKRDEYIANEQSVDLTTTDQKINLPSGRHQLAFKSFHLQLFQKRVVLDSCTISAVTTDSAKSSYNIFFKRLSLIGADFNAMYRYNLIKADSVYCEEPYFDINLNSKDRNTANAKKRERPDLENIIRDLTGDLELAFVGVRDAGIRIDISGNKNRSLFNSRRDNFEMRGLRINADSAKPIVVDRFDMLVREYQLYNIDSSTSYSFDSIHFLNNKVVLNNFAIKTQSSSLKRRSERDIVIPYFELTGMDWFELAFEQNLRAREAVLYNPVINYRKVGGIQKKKKTDFFSSLQSLDSLMTLGKVTILNGQLNVEMNSTTSVSMQDVNLSIHTDALMKSTNREGLRRAVEFLSFRNGIFKTKDLTAQLRNIRFTGKNLIHLDQALVDTRKQTVKAQINDIYLDNLLIDDQVEKVVLDGLRWRSANLVLKTGKSTRETDEQGVDLQLKNISGRNTRLSMISEKGQVQTLIGSLAVVSLHKQNGQMSIEGLDVQGSNLKFEQPNVKLSAASYVVRQNKPSVMNDVALSNIKQTDSTILKAPRIEFVPDVNAMLNKDIHLNSLSLPGADLTIRKKRVSTDSARRNAKALVRIDKVSLPSPSVDIRTSRNDSVTIIDVPRRQGAAVSASGVMISDGNFEAKSLTLNTSTLRFKKPNGDIFGVDSGQVNITLANLGFGRKNGQPFWTASVQNLDLDRPNELFIGKSRNRLVFEKLSVGELSLGSGYITDFRQFLKANLSLWLRSGTGRYSDSNTTVNWYNADYRGAQKLFSLDSFSIMPTKPKDSVIAASPYQTDYITFISGPVKATNFDLSRYEKDSAVFMNSLELTRPVITVFRDKKPPFFAGRIKPLPTALIQQLSVPVSIGRISMADAQLEYSEKHPRTRAEGTLALRRMNVTLSNIRNFGLTPTDSLTLQMTSYLMDSAYLNLRVRQSYTDTLRGFLMTLRMRPTTLAFLNPVLAPLSNVKITSGRIDSLQLRAIANDAVAVGQMRMFYRHLKIKLVKDGDEEKTSFFGNIASFLVNAILIKKNNSGRVGLVYFERLRDRSFFNYLVKTAFSGMATSVGVVKNRKYTKKYAKLLEKRDLPAVEFEE